MDVIVQNSGKVRLDQSAFVGAGGEGSVYAKGQTAYKIYTNPSKMIPAGKISELSTITNRNVIKPEDIILSTKNKPIGYTMRFVNDTHVLCQLFTRTFREQNGVNNDIITKLVRNFYDLIKHIHSKNILVVDLNELNFLISRDYLEIYAIDCDSYQTKSYPATAIMENIRDRHCNYKFSQETDWFAFGILTCNMFVGIHPFKGRHSKYKNFDDRMMNNISIFNKDVSIPKICYPFENIPEAYRQWYKAIFDEGKRVAPPSDFTIVAEIQKVVKHIVGAQNFDIIEDSEYDGAINEICINGKIKLVRTTTKFYHNNNHISVSPSVRFALTPHQNIPVLAKIELNKLKLFNANTEKEITNININCSILMTYNQRLYVKNQDKILEIEFIESGQNILTSYKVVANILEQATTLFDGVAVQNLLGTHYASVFPEPGIHRQVRLKELDSYKIVQAKFDSGVLMIIGARTIVKNLQYDKLVFKFSADFNNYSHIIIENVELIGLNFVVLDNGICVQINEQEQIEVFSAKKDQNTVKIIDDPVIESDMKLMKSGAKVLFARGNKLFSLKMR